MNIGFMALSSGSSGNCYLIRTEKTKVLLDLGISCRSIKTLLAGQGLELKDIDINDMIKLAETFPTTTEKEKEYMISRIRASRTKVVRIKDKSRTEDR